MKRKVVSCMLIIAIMFSYVPAIMPKVEAIASGDSWSYQYTGNVQSFTVPATGTYKIEAWGAQGANGGLSGRNADYSDWNVGDSKGRKGSYQSGNIYLQKGDILYIYCGGAASGATGGWNGGGNGAGYKSEATRQDANTTTQTSGFSAGGGGATDVRKNGTNLSNRILVAGGGYSGYVGYMWVGYKRATSGGHLEAGLDESSNGILGQGSDYKHLSTEQVGRDDHR